MRNVTVLHPAVAAALLLAASSCSLAGAMRHRQTADLIAQYSDMLDSDMSADAYRAWYEKERSRPTSVDRHPAPAPRAWLLPAIAQLDRAIAANGSEGRDEAVGLRRRLLRRVVSQTAALSAPDASPASPAEALAALHADLAEVGRALGYDNILQLTSDAFGIDPKETADQARALLDASEDLYVSANSDDDGHPRPHLELDWPRAYAALRTLLRKSGPEARDAATIWVDVEADDDAPRARMVAAEPHEARLALRPARNVQELATALAASGRAAAWTCAGHQAPEARALATAAALAGSLAGNPAWLADHAPIAADAQPSAVHAEAVTRLRRVRSDALLTLVLAEPAGTDLAVRIAKLLERTDLSTSNARDWVEAPLRLFASLEAAARAAQRPEWWREPGETLCEAGPPTLAPDLLLRQIAERLLRPPS